MTIADPTSAAMRRREDPPLLTGAARYTDDLAGPGALQAAFVRAPLAHGRVLAVERAAAVAMPAVVGVFTAADLALPPMPAGSAPAAFARPVLAEATVRFLGEPVAVVVAETRAQALDAVEAVAVDYEPLPVVVDPLAAADDQAPLLFPEAGSNLAKQRAWPRPSTALDGAEVVVTARFVNQRLAAVPLEPNAALAVPDPERDAVTLYVPCQAPFWVRDTVAEALGLPAERVPVAAYRGAGRPEATAMLERAVDLLAGELGMDPAELRRRNLLRADELPYDTPTKARYDSGDFPAALERVLEAAGYPALRAEQAERRRRGDRRQLGIGLSVYVEVTGFGSEHGAVAVEPDGRVTVRTGTAPHGQGHETAFTQLVVAILGVDPDEVTVVHSDTALVPSGDGTMGSRSLQVGGSAILQAAEQVLDKARTLAAHLLEARVEDVAVFPGEGLGVAGAPSTALPWRELATAAADPARRPAGTAPGLDAAVDFELPDATYPFGAHLAVCEVDVETGRARLVRYLAVDDAGRIHNPLLAEGQVHGGIAQGVAQALYEEVRYDRQGNCLTGTLASYAMPSAADLPAFETERTQTPSPLNPLGAKGIGESGAVGATPAVQNAVVDAVRHLGVTHVDMPLTPKRVWRAIRAADPPVT